MEKRRHSTPWKALIIVFIFSTAFRGIIAVRYGQYNVFGDEILHVKLAQGIAAGYGLMLRGALFNYTVCLYSLVISPVFLLTQNMETAHAMILCINALLMSSALFPIYFLASKYLENRKHVWLTVAYGLLLGEMHYTLQAMQESLNYPLMMWFFVAFSHIVVDKNTSRNGMIGLGACSFLLSICKSMNLALIIAVPAFLLIQALIDKQIRRRSIIGCVVYTLTFLFLKGLYDSVMGFFLQNAINGGLTQINIRGVLNWTTIRNLIYPAVLYVLYTILATGVFIIPLLISNWKVLCKRAQKMLMLSLIYVLFSIGAICLMIVVRENLGDAEIRYHSRYFFYSFILFVILFMHLYEQFQKAPHCVDVRNFTVIMGLGSVLLTFLPLIPNFGCHVDGPSTLFLRLFAENDVSKVGFRCILIVLIWGAIYSLQAGYFKRIYFAAAVILSIGAAISPYYYIARNVDSSSKNDALILNDYFAKQVSDMMSDKQILLLESDDFAGNFRFECYFNEPYRCTTPSFLSVGELNLEEITLLSYNLVGWTDPDAPAPEYIVNMGGYHLQGYDEVEIGLEKYHLFRKNGQKPKLIYKYKESGIYGDRWLGANAATLQLAGTYDSTSAQLVLRVDNWLLNSDITINYKDSTGYMGNFKIPKTKEQVDICIPIYKMSSESSYTIALIPTQSIVPGNGDTRSLSFRLFNAECIEEQ